MAAVLLTHTLTHRERRIICSASASAIQWGVRTLHHHETDTLTQHSTHTEAIYSMMMMISSNRARRVLVVVNNAFGPRRRDSRDFLSRGDDELQRQQRISSAAAHNIHPYTYILYIKKEQRAPGRVIYSQIFTHQPFRIYAPECVCVCVCVFFV